MPSVAHSPESRMSQNGLVYLDCSATTPLAPEVLSAMRPFLEGGYGNASGAYSLGRKARAAVEDARRRVARALNCQPAELVFTSGGSESDNLAVRGVAQAARLAGRPAHLVTTPIEHKAVLATVHEAERCFGCTATVVSVDAQARVDPEAVLDAVRPDTVLVSVMLANNEVGTLEPVAEIGALLRERGILFHTDAVQAGAWLSLDVQQLNVDLLSLSAHKFYGPKGVGILYVREGTALATQQTGGGQERGHRAGTENVVGIVGLAAALDLVQAEREAACARVAALRDRLVAGLTALPGVRLTGHPTARLPHHASFCIDGLRADVLLLGLDMRGICASSGSACSSGKLEPSHVLSAMGVPDHEAVGALRFSLGRQTREPDIDRVLDVLPGLVERLRGAPNPGGPQPWPRAQ
jgi:cysteine desulfurase